MGKLVGILSIFYSEGEGGEVGADGAEFDELMQVESDEDVVLPAAFVLPSWVPPGREQEARAWAQKWLSRAMRVLQKRDAARK